MEILINPRQSADLNASLHPLMCFHPADNLHMGLSYLSSFSLHTNAAVSASSFATHPNPSFFTLWCFCLKCLLSQMFYSVKGSCSAALPACGVSTNGRATIRALWTEPKHSSTADEITIILWLRLSWLNRSFPLIATMNEYQFNSMLWTKQSLL